MMTLAVAGIGLAIGVPAFNGFMANSRMTAGVNDLVSALHLARSEAIKRHSTVTICPANAELTACDDGATLADGWLVFQDDNSDGQRQDSETSLYSREALDPDLADNFTAGGRPDAAAYVAFNRLGQRPPDGSPLSDSASDFLFCDHRGNLDTGAGNGAARWIQLHATGHPQIHRRLDEIANGPLGSCPD
jgi:type IV fimbrial biogenesis protein FimT